MLITDDKITEIFFMTDEFCHFFDTMMEKYTIKDPGKRSYHRDGKMTKAEVMTIMIIFHASGYRCFKHFYTEYVCRHMRHMFPKTVSYNRMVELEKSVALPLALFVKKVLLGKCMGVSFVDSTPLRVCKNQRIHIHKTFRGIAQRGKCSMGWFFGFKLHLICNEKGELLNFMITPGDIDDRKPLEYKAFVDAIYVKLVGDKGYISRHLFERLFVDGIQLITKLKSNMRGDLMSMYDRLLKGGVLVKAEEATRFDVDTRTIQRDLDDIRAHLSEEGARDRELVYDRNRMGYVVRESRR